MVWFNKKHTEVKYVEPLGSPKIQSNCVYFNFFFSSEVLKPYSHEDILANTLPWNRPESYGQSLTMSSRLLIKTKTKHIREWSHSLLFLHYEDGNKADGPDSEYTKSKWERSRTIWGFGWQMTNSSQ